MRVSIVGTGYVGLVSGVGLAHAGHDVICVDIDERKVDQINRGEAPIFEEGLDELLSAYAGKRLSATSDLAEAVRQTSVTIIAVGTPFDGRQIDLQFVRLAAQQIGDALRAKGGYHVVVVKSTVVPGTTRDVVLPILESASGKQAGSEFGVAMNPEFLAEGTAVRDFNDPDRIVIGGIDDRTCNTVAELYQPFSDAAIVRTDPTTAEMIKYTANALFATMISFSNEIGNLCARTGTDVVEVMQGVHLDRRLSPIAKGGTRVTPGFLGYLAAGCGFGGSCFPKDIKALVAFGQDEGEPMQILDAVVNLNAEQPFKVLDLLHRRIPSAGGLKIAVLGVAFKPGTDDIRESPSIPVVHALLSEGARTFCFDPAAAEPARSALPAEVVVTSTLEEAIRDADAILIMTAWPEFQRVPSLLNMWGQFSVIVDGRRILSKDDVAAYEGIGLSRRTETQCA